MAIDGEAVLTCTTTDLWALHECIAPSFAGWNGRHETAEPWHGTSLLDKVWEELAHDIDSHALSLKAAELRVILYNVPITAYAGARALHLQVIKALSDLTSDLPPIMETEPDRGDWRANLRRYSERQWPTP